MYGLKLAILTEWYPVTVLRIFLQSPVWETLIVGDF